MSTLDSSWFHVVHVVRSELSREFIGGTSLTEPLCFMNKSCFLQTILIMTLYFLLHGVFVKMY